MNSEAPYLQDVQRPQLSPAPLLRAVYLGAFDDDGVGREIHTPGQGCCGDQDLQRKGKAVRETDLATKGAHPQHSLNFSRHLDSGLLAGQRWVPNLSMKHQNKEERSLWVPHLFKNHLKALETLKRQ